MEEPKPPNLYTALRTKHNSRLLSLICLVGPEDGALECELKEFDLDAVHENKIKYEGLSYVWGDPESTESIICNGHQVQVTVNLLAALTQIWSEDPDLILWVDSLCINQRDIVEKAVQVNLMRDIYHGARSVLVWLGASNGADVGVVWRALRRELPPDPEREYLEVEHLNSDLPMRPGYDESRSYWGIVAEIPKYSNLYRAVHNVLRRAWFDRVWTLQEILHAREDIVICGTLRMEWTSFTVAMEKVCANYMIELYVKGHFSCIGKCRAVIKKQSKTLTSILLLSWHREASVPVDHIYAIFSLIPSAQYPGLSVNYGISPQQLSIRITRVCLFVDRSLSLLRVAGLNMHLGQESHYDDETAAEASQLLHYELPSWVPDWCHGLRSSTSTELLFRSDLLLEEMLNDTEASVSGYDALVDCRPEEDPALLTLRGLVIGRLVKLDPQVDSGGDYLIHTIPGCVRKAIRLLLNTSRLLGEDETSAQMRIACSNLLPLTSKHDRQNCTCAVGGYMAAPFDRFLLNPEMLPDSGSGWHKSGDWLFNPLGTTDVLLLQPSTGRSLKLVGYMRLHLLINRDKPHLRYTLVDRLPPVQGFVPTWFFQPVVAECVLS